MTPSELQVVPKEEAITPSGLLQMAVSQGADIDKLTKLMELQERWERNQAKKAFDLAMAKFKENPPRITKNKHVKFGQTEYDHATLDHLCDLITPALSAVGISHKWTLAQSPEIAVTCVLTHELGHSEETTLRAGADTSGSKNAIQAIGSTVRYLQRYTLFSATGLAAGEDDDGRSSEPTGNRVADELVIERLDWIENARDMEELKRVYTNAVKMAQQVGDKNFEAQLIKAANARKVAIREGR